MLHVRQLTIGLALLVTACGPSPEVRTTDASAELGGPVQFNLREISAESRGCTEPDGRCARVKVISPETTGGGTAAVRENIDLFIDHDLVSRMRSFVPEEIGNGLGSVEELAAAFLAEFRAFVVEFPDASGGWSIEVEGTPVYNTERVATLDIHERASTGGAHPNSRRRLVSFDVETGQLLGIDDLTNDLEALTSLAERQLGIDYDLEPGDDLESAGFWFNDEVGFSLPDNVGVVAEGLIFHWDPYEIAPYSMGPINLSVPASELEAIIDRDYW